MPNNNKVFKEILLYDVENDATLDLKSDYRAEANVLKFNAGIEYNTISTRYGAISRQKNTFVPQVLQFTSYNIIKKDIAGFQDFFHTENEHYQLRFKMANEDEYQHVYCRLDYTNIEQIDQNDLFKFDIQLTTETPYFVVDSYSVGSHGETEIKQVGDRFEVRHEHRFGSSANDNLVEMPLDFKIRGKLGAFLLVNMFGESDNPMYGINGVGTNVNTKIAYVSKNVTIKDNEMLSINTYLPLKKIELNRVSIEQDRFFKYDTFEIIPPFPQNQKIIFSNVPYAEVKVCSITPNLRFGIYE